MATTQLESGSFMVGMDRDCMSVAMSKLLYPHEKPTDCTPPQKKKKFLKNWKNNLTFPSLEA